MNYVELFEILHSGHLCVCVFSRIFCPLFLHLDKGVWVSAPIRCYLPTMSHVPAIVSMCSILMCQHQQYLWSTCTTKTTWWIYSEHISKEWFWQVGQYVCSMTFVLRKSWVSRLEIMAKSRSNPWFPSTSKSHGGMTTIWRTEGAQGGPLPPMRQKKRVNGRIFPEEKNAKTVDSRIQDDPSFFKSTCR